MVLYDRRQAAHLGVHSRELCLELGNLSLMQREGELARDVETEILVLSNEGYAMKGLNV